jgi:hypothetical protein
MIGLLLRHAGESMVSLVGAFLSTDKTKVTSSVRNVPTPLVFQELQMRTEHVLRVAPSLAIQMML